MGKLQRERRCFLQSSSFWARFPGCMRVTDYTARNRHERLIWTLDVLFGRLWSGDVTTLTLEQLVHCLDGVCFRAGHTLKWFFFPLRAARTKCFSCSPPCTRHPWGFRRKTPEKNARKGRGSVCGNNDPEAPKYEANGAFKFKLMDLFIFFLFYFFVRSSSRQAKLVGASKLRQYLTWK